MLTINDISVSYGGHRVLNQLSLECQTGTLHGILGMNGAGKTTLFRTIYGFKKKQEGTCLYKGKPVASRDIGFLETDNFFYSYMKGREYLELLSEAGKGFDLVKWNSIFQLPLEELIDTYSTGMKKKLAFMGILALDRPIMILDEPFSGVDVESNEKIFQILGRLKDQGKTILISSHILSSLTGTADEISFLKNGRIERKYSKAEFPELERQLKEHVQKNINAALEDLL